MSPAETEMLLEEWARWARNGNHVAIGWPPSSAFGRLIKPDPSPSTMPIDELRAEVTERVVAKLPGRYRYLVKLHFLDPSPVESKCRRLRCRRETYRHLMVSVVEFVSRRLDGTLESVYFRQSAGSA